MATPYWFLLGLNQGQRLCHTNYWCQRTEDVIRTAVCTVTEDMFKNIWREQEYRLICAIPCNADKNLLKTNIQNYIFKKRLVFTIFSSVFLRLYIFFPWGSKKKFFNIISQKFFLRRTNKLEDVSEVLNARCRLIKLQVWRCRINKENA